MNIASVFCVTWSPLKLAAHAHSSDSNIISVNAGDVLCWVYQKWPDECPSIVSSVYTHRVVTACTNFKQIVQILHADNYPHNSDCWKYN